MGLVCPSGTHINKHAVRNQSQDQHTQGQVFQSSASNAKTTKLKRAVIAASPAFWLLKPQKFISQSVSNISDDYVVSKRGRQHVEAFSFLSQSWQMGRGLEQLFNLKGGDLTLSLFTFLSSQSYLPKHFFPNFTVSYFSQFSAPSYLQPLHSSQSIKSIIAYINEAIGKKFSFFFLFEWPKCRCFIGYSAITQP